MKFILVLALALSTTAFAESTTPRNGDEKDYKIIKDKDGKVEAEKNVKTNGKISSSGCELASGKTVTQGEQDYDECVRQIGMKKKHKKKH